MAKGGLSLFGAIMMNVNLMVGAAAFIGPAMMAQYAHSASFYGWIWAALLFFPVVWSIAQITKLYPGKGSFYAYSKNGISSTAGFISGWVYFLGYVSIGSVQLLNLTEILSKQFQNPFFADNVTLVTLFLLTALLFLSFLPIKAIEKLQTSATLFKLTPLLIVLGSIPLYFSFDKIPSPFATSPTLLLPTVPMAIFGFWGFEGACSVSHLIDGDKNTPAKAILYGFGIASSIYLLFHLGLLLLMGAKPLTTEGVSSFINYMNLNPQIKHYISALISSAIIVAHINAVFGGMIANGSIFCAMAEEKLVFLSNMLSTRTDAGRPFGAVIAHTLGLFLFVTLIASKTILNAMSNLGLLTAFFLTIISLYLLQAKKKDTVGKAISILGLGSCTLLSYYSWQIMGSTAPARIGAASPFLVVMLLGYIMYMHAQRKEAAKS